MLKIQLWHFTADSVLLTSQETFVIQNHLPLGPAWTCLHQGKTRLRNSPCIWDQLDQSSEMVKVPEGMLGLCGSQSDSVSSHQNEHVCCTLWGEVKIQVDVWQFIKGKAVKVQEIPTLIQPYSFPQVNSALGHREVFAISALCHHFHNKLSSLNL